MEDIIQILIFVGAMVIAVVGQNVKNKKKSTHTSPEEVLEDLFPETHDVQEPIVLERKRTPHKIPTATQSSHQSNIEPSSPKKTQKIRLNCREEAKRAFIYSEIFNRKY